MRKSAHSPEYKHVLKELVSLRHAAGLTQRELATMLNRERSFVWRIEKGERRIDLVEFYWFCRVLGVNPRTRYRMLIDAIERDDSTLPEPNIPYQKDKAIR